jgi:acyl-CoA hydrolase
MIGTVARQTVTRVAQPEILQDVEAAVDRILAHAGERVVVALPLALGKPNALVNALYRRVAADPKRSLEFITALSLARPRPSRGLEARFARPFLDRHFGADYPDLDYVRDRAADNLPANVRIVEFYLQSGSALGNARAQRDYASINYTHVAREVAARGVNVLVQLVARRGDRLSLSCNPDVTLDLIDRLAADGLPPAFVVGVVHPDLPFMGHDAEVGLDAVDVLIEPPGQPQRLFAVPRGEVALAEFALGLHASALVRDGGSLQIGIGALSDALVHALLLRQRDNASYTGALAALWPDGEPPPVIASVGGLAPLARGLYGASEMVMDGFMHLRRAGILKRRVFDHVALQDALNAGALGETLGAGAADALVAHGVLPEVVDAAALRTLVRFGALPDGARLDGGAIVLPDGARVGRDLADAVNRAALDAAMAGRHLRGGRFLHGAFYLGSQPLYDWLRTLDADDYDGVCMTRVSHVNELYGGAEALHRAQRRDARFFNTCMMQTLLGATVSDALADGQVVSGVGGQYNFVAMAHALAGARSVLMLRASRDSGGRTVSNVVWNYAHHTIPRHLRDVVVTEYGLASIRGSTDETCIRRLLCVADSRFQESLREEAVRAGKLDPVWAIPAAYRDNTPDALRRRLAPFVAQGLFPRHPFGSEFDALELRLVDALKRLKRESRGRAGGLRVLWRALTTPPGPAHRDALARLGLAHPASLREWIESRAVCWALDRAGPD